MKQSELNVRTVFDHAVEINNPDSRESYVIEVCNDDPDLRAAVEALLLAHDKAGSFLGAPACWSECLTQSWDSASDKPNEDEGLDLTFLEPSTAPDALGRLGHYEVKQVIGKGGFGIVLRAFDEHLHRMVAIKVMAPQLSVTSPARKRFLREARAAASVRHDNVVTIYSVEERPIPYLVMELVAGQSLQEKLDQTGPVDVVTALRWGYQIASGLAAAHARGVIHRDIKPGNILLESGDRVKITDFGLARTIDDASQTQSGVIAGTPMYMSPEQTRSEAVDHRTDLFSLGSVLYMMVSGRPPFRAAGTLAVLRRVAEDTARPIQEIIPETPGWLCDLIGKLHTKDPSGRYSSAQEVADQLGVYLRERTDNAFVPANALVRSLPVGMAAEPEPRSIPARRAGRLSRWVAAAAVLLASIGIGITEAAGVTDVRSIVIRVFSPEGTLIVEVEDPGVSVRIDGQDMVITGTGAKEIRLKPGQYKMQASKDGKVVRQDVVTVARGGRQIVRVTHEPPAIQPVASPASWEAAVARMPVEGQVKAVAERLRELNPKFDGRVTPVIEHGVVTGLSFSALGVDDLSPVRVLQGLKTLRCAGVWPKQSQLTNLAPLAGLQLSSLCVRDTRVADLSPLKSMPLETLDVLRTSVTDLTPLQGLRLKKLTCGRTLIRDLRPLSGQPLTQLDVNHTRVSDLSPLQGMPLTRLGFNDTPVGNISALKGMPLVEVTARLNPNWDLNILRSLKTLEVINGRAAADSLKKVEPPPDNDD